MEKKKGKHGLYLFFRFFSNLVVFREIRRVFNAGRPHARNYSWEAARYDIAVLVQQFADEGFVLSELMPPTLEL